MSLLLGYDHGSASVKLQSRSSHFCGVFHVLSRSFSTKSSFNVIAWIAPGLEQHRVHATCPNSVHCISREDLRCNSSDVLPDRNCESLQTYSSSKSWLLLKQCLGTPSAAGPTSLGSLIGRAWGAELSPHSSLWAERGELAAAQPRYRILPLQHSCFASIKEGARLPCLGS
jgi:hypothetical protein